MERQELLDYLQAVCDAENALYACEEAVAEMQQKRDALQYPSAPTKPVLTIAQKKKGSYGEIFGGSAAGFAAFGVIACEVYFFISVANDTWGGPDGPILGFVVGVLCFILAGIIGYLAGGLLGIISSPIWMLIDSKRRTNRQQKDQLGCDTRYSTAMQEYENQLSTYNAQVALLDAVGAMLAAQIEEQQEKHGRIAQKLQTLYERDIIHKRFREIVAVNQINEYMETGICETLEGSNGAYAMYKDDVRAQRICDSIDDMKVTLKEALNRVAQAQAAIAREIRENSIRIREMGGIISAGFESMEQSIQRTQSVYADGVERLEKSNSHLEEMEKALKTCAHNEYVALREADINSYLLRKP